MNRIGHIMVKMKIGEPLHAPCHLDVMAGASRPSNSIDGGGLVDRTLLRRTGAMRVRRAFHARKSLGRMGEQAAHYDDVEQSLGLSQTVSVELSDLEECEALVNDLHSLQNVEWATPEQLSCTTIGGTSSVDHNPLSRDELWQPYLHVGAEQALHDEPGSAGILVAVIDTGVALEHDEFNGKLHTGFDTVDLGMGFVSGGVRLVGDSSGRDFCARDETGHGSHVAGVLGANGMYLPPGVAGRSRILPIRALAAAQVDGNKLVGVGGLLDIDAGIKVAVDLGAKVLNMSFGTPAMSLDEEGPVPHSDVIEYALNRGVIPVAAMGNSGSEEKYYPAALDGVIAVGSMSINGKHSEFSTMGDHLTLCAPGENIISTGLKGYKSSTGTSHAAPFVAGAVALMAARSRKHSYELSMKMARRILSETASLATTNLRTKEIGSGMLNIPAALYRLNEVITQKVEYGYG